MTTISLVLGILGGLITSYFFLYSQRSVKKNFKIVSAGAQDTDDVVSIPINLSNKNFIFEGKDIDTDGNQYVPFVVKGNSMGSLGINTSDFLLVNIDIDKLQIETGSAVVFKIDKLKLNDEYSKLIGNGRELKRIDENLKEINRVHNFYYKVSQLLGYVDINNENEAILSTLVKKDPDLSKEIFKKLLFERLNKARSSGINNQKVTISIDINNGEKNYYINTIDEIYGCAKYVFNNR